MPNGQALAARLREQFSTLDEFQTVATDAVAYLKAGKPTTAASRTAGRQHYGLWNFQGTGRQIALRPVNTDLYIDKPAEFTITCRAVLGLLKDLAKNRGPSAALLKKHRSTIDSGTVQRVFYTMQQSYGLACDALMEDANQARKHVGMKFEAIVGATFKALEIASGHLVFNISGGEGEPRYRAETDFVIGPDRSVISTSSIHDPREVIVSVKGSSKDRMAKIFIDLVVGQAVFLGENDRHLPQRRTA